MRARDVIGRTIVGIRQQRAITAGKQVVYDLGSLILDNGKVIVLVPVECEGTEPVIQGMVLDADDYGAGNDQ